MQGVKRNLFFNFLLSLSQVLVPLVSIPYVSRMLDPEGVGKVGFIDGFTYYFVVLAEAGIMVYGIREVARVRHNPSALKVLVNELISLHLRTSLLSILLYSLGVWLMWSRIGDWRLVSFSIAFLLTNAWACEWYFIGQERFGFIALRSIIVRLAGLVSLLLLIEQPDDYFIYYAIIAGSAIVTLIWNVSVLFREHPFQFRNSGWRKHLRKLWVTYLISLLYSVPLYLDHVILRLLSTASIVGYYTFAIRLLRVGGSLISDSFLVFFPRVASLHAANDTEGVQERLHQNLQFVFFLAVPMSVGVFLLAGEITDLFFGPQFAAAVLNIQILSVYPLLRSFSLFLSNPVMIGHGFERSFLRSLVFSTAIYLLLATVAAWQYGGPGICAALVLSDMALVVLNYGSVNRLMPALRVMDWPLLLRAALVSALFYPTVLLIRNATDLPFFRLLWSIPACVLLYLSVMYIWMPAGTFRDRWHTMVKFARRKT
ncbi:MAG: oligosaccharide flippase family protein [Chitinophagaceae bacterium]